MRYSPDMDKDGSVRKLHFGKEILYMVPDDEGNFMLCSNDERLQKWCETVEDVGFIKDKKVPEIYWRFVLGAAQDFLEGKPLGTNGRELTHVMSEAPEKDYVIRGKLEWDGCIIVGSGRLPDEKIKGLKNPQLIYQTFIKNSLINSEFINSLPAMKDQPKKTSTQMVVDFNDAVMERCGTCGLSGLHAIEVSEKAGFDDLCAAWVIRESTVMGKMPELAEDLAKLTHKVVYEKNDMPIKEYAKTLPACVDAILAEIRGREDAELMNGIDPANVEVLKVLDALEAEKTKDPNFNIETADICEFIEQSPDIKKETKKQMHDGLEQLKVTLIPTNEASEYYQEHIVGRHGKESTTIGSKMLRDIPDEYMLALLGRTDKQYQALIDEDWRPGRVVFAVEADRPIGTNAVYPLENIDSSVVFSTIREPGTENGANIKVALISEEDMPKTNIAQVIMGNYGPTGKAGIYTMIFGDEGMPFAENIVKKDPENVDLIADCMKYWRNHVVLITPEELKANIADLKAKGYPAKAQELALKSFELRGKTNPIVKSYTPEISPSAVKIKMPTLKGKDSRTNG